MKPKLLALIAGMVGMASLAAAPKAPPSPPPDWPQWGRNAQHAGMAAAAGQPTIRVLADVVSDPFVDQEVGGPLSPGDLLVHYQAPLVAGADVFIEEKSGDFTSSVTWGTQTWNERKLHWRGNRFVPQWRFASDWKPVPFSTGGRGPNWEPVFHAALAGRWLYVPGAGGSVYKLDAATGSVAARVRPFGPAVDPDLYLCGALAVDAQGDVFYNAIQLARGQAWTADVRGSWLVEVRPDGSSATVSYAALTAGAPAGGDLCAGTFDDGQLPWPPSPDAVAPRVPCGSQRAALNLAPAVAPDGTIYTVSVAHFTPRTAYLLAVGPDLAPRWAASLRERLHDGCNVLLPPTGTPGGCRTGAADGVDPAENRPGSGQVLDNSTASPVVAPDGSVLLGVFTRYNYSQGHLMRFGPDGAFLGAYPFGWDTTPAIYAHDRTYSVVLKDNRYGDVGSYCNRSTVCPSDRTANHPASPEGYFLTQLSPDLAPEWSWRNANDLSCIRQGSDQVTCVSDHPAGFEWCVNAVAIDSRGVVYANSEDGNVYAVEQGGTLRDHLFLDRALGAAYTPFVLGGDGKLYAQNAGHLVVVGGCRRGPHGRGCR